MKYEPTIDALNQPDWIMYFTPGPKAYEEFNAAHRTRKSKLNTEPTEVGEGQVKRRHYVTRENRLKHELAQPPVSFDPQLVSELTRRGVTEKKAREVLSHLKPGQDALAQLELGDQHIAKGPPSIRTRLVSTSILSKRILRFRKASKRVPDARHARNKSSATRMSAARNMSSKRNMSGTVIRRSSALSPRLIRPKWPLFARRSGKRWRHSTNPPGS